MALTAEERKRQEAARKRAQEQDRRAAEARRKQAALEKDQKARRDQILSDARTREERTRITANKSSRKAEVEQARRRGEVADIHGGGEAARRRMEAEIKSIRAKYRQGVKPATKKPAAKPTAKPATKPAEKPYVATYTDAQGNVYDGNTGRYLRTMSRGAAKPSPAPSASRPSTSSSSRSSGSTSTPKPAGKVPSSTAGMKNQDKNFRGNPERQGSIASTLRELRGMGSGRKAAESKMSKPEDKSRYVASNGKPYKGPAFGSGKAEPKKPASPASPNKSEKGMTLAERMRRRRMGMA